MTADAVSPRQGLYNTLGLDDRIPREVRVCDVTLREGEQTPGVRLPLGVKLELAGRLDALGVAQIQLNHVTHAGVEAEAAALRRLGLAARLEIMTSASRTDWREAIARAIDAGTDIVHTNLAASPHVRHMYAPMSDGALCERTAEAVRFARERGGRDVSVTFVDAPRVHPELMDGLVDAAVGAGAARLRLPDSVGVATPRGMSQLVRRVRERVRRSGRAVVLGAHCHNDYGCAAANTYACVEEGAALVDLAVNGLGERAGNADLATVVTVLETVYGCRTGIDLSALSAMSRLVAEATGRPVPGNMPMVGETVFSDLEGIHLRAQSRDPFAFQGFPPELVGNRRRLLIGIFAGEAAARAKLAELGLGVDGARLPDFAAALREHAAASPDGLVRDAAFRSVAHSFGAAAAGMTEGDDPHG